MYLSLSNGILLLLQKIIHHKMKKLYTILFLLILGSPISAQDTSDRNFEIGKSIDIFSALVKDLDLYYVDTLETKSVVRKGIDYMLGQLDPYTVFYSSEDMGDLKMMTTGKYAGIGSVIRMYQKDKVVISEPYANSPAARSGLKAGDILLQIDDIDLKGKTTTDVSSLLRGEPETSFILKVKRPGVEKPMTFKITRETITTPAVPYYGLVSTDIGYINFNSFTENCSKDIRNAAIELKNTGAKGLVIDLRNNGGGLLSEAVEIVNLFLPKGKLVLKTQGKTKQSSHEYLTTKEPLYLDIPLVVLVNGNTASSSEIMAGTLQDYDRGVVVGSRTYGKGLVQSVREMPYSSSMKLTTSKYYIPSGRCVQAIDYKNRDGMGRATRIADSLTHVFHTEAGREVRDGGGIRPDVEVKLDTVANITAYLAVDDVVFDYATEYYQKHPNLKSVSDFEITDEDYADFCEKVKNSDFKYDRQTENALESLQKIAEFEGYLESAKEEFEALKNKLTHNVDFDLEQNKKDIKQILSDEIIKRYFYQAGSVEQSLKYDPTLDKAIEILHDDTLYKSILTVKK